MIQKIILGAILIGLLGWAISNVVTHYDYNAYGLGVIAIQGEQFNYSTNYGSFSVSPQVDEELMGTSLMLLIIFFCSIMFTLGGGLKLFKQESRK